MVWREPQDHTKEYYFCLVGIKGHNKKSLRSTVYFELRSARYPVPHSETDSPTTPTTQMPPSSDSEDYPPFPDSSPQYFELLTKQDVFR
ncbi:UNVERIFIED_CONTAM: hypothetical protein RMT77_018585 [Armadillidium vulgare]